ncbi:MAG: TonB-dependent receptor, partial [Bacteroidia bacterium]
DNSLRAMLTYGSARGITGINITAAFISDKLDYTNELASVDSRNHSKRIILKSRFDRRINEILKLEIALNDELNIINTNNYAGDRARNLFSADAVAEAELTQWMGARILVREMIQDNSFLMPDFSASTEIRPFSEKYYFIKASFSRNSKIPTLNDMYWSPGGNPDLKNETGYSSEITWEMTSFPSATIRIKNDLTFFRNDISDMIQWHPGESYYWEAGNIGNIVTTGLESALDASFSFRELDVRLNAGYAYTKAVIAGPGTETTNLSGKQLAYIPANQINALLRLSWRQFYSSIGTGFTGKRFLTSDNSQYLPQYSASDITVGAKLNAGHASFDLNLIIENLFDVNYQNIAYYPMPGRSFLVSIVLQLKK